MTASDASILGSPEPPSSRVLVDSSIWIDFYRPAPRAEIREAVVGALARDAVFTAALVLAEVVQGAPDEAALSALVEDLSALRSVDLGPTVGAMAGRIGYALRRRGTPAPATDLLIAAAALSEDCELWHQDAHFRSIAQVAPLRERSF